MKYFLLFLFFILFGINSFGNSSSKIPYDIIRERFVELTNNGGNEKKAIEFIETINKNPNKTYLWDAYPDMKNGANILSTYRNLTEIIKSYTNKNSKLYKNKETKILIINSLEWLRENAYQEKFPELGNWWQWEIGIPKELNKIVAYMYSDLSPKDIKKFLAGSQYFQPYAEWSGYSESAKTSTSPNKRLSTGGNRIDTCLIVFMRGILSKNPSEIKNSLDNIAEVGAYVTSGDGFYKDGSFIQHETIPYGGTYGAVLLNGLGIIQNLIANTNLEIKDPRFFNIYDSIISGYNYVFFQSRISDSLSGRAVTRDDSSDMDRGMDNLIAIAMISQGAPKEYKYKLQEIVKRNLEENDLYYIPAKIKNPVEKRIIENILKDNNILANPLLGLKIFGNMDRVVSRTPNYSFLISMHSSRVGNFESILGENLRGWHSSDGMYYLYTNNQQEYFEYWPTVDPYHLPGTTESINQRKDVTGQRRVAKHMVQKDFVGGSTDNTNAIIGMDFSSWNDLTTAKKSWFISPDFVLAIGSNITSTDGVIHTTLENKIIKNESQIIENTPEKLIIKNTTGLNTAFISLDKNTLTTSVEERVSSWKEAGGKNEKKIFKNFVKSFINHGNNPKNKTYLYCIIPENSLEKINNFNKNEIKILSQNEIAHGIQYKNITAINFWEGTNKTIGNFIGKTPMSLLAIKDNNKLSIFLSDPTHKNPEGILEINGEYNLITPNDNITLTHVNGFTVINIIGLNNGQTLNFQLQK